MLTSNHKKMLGYLLVRRIILFLAFHEYLTRMNRDSKFKNENSKCCANKIDGYSYDANGNMTRAPGKTLTYDYDNMPVSIGSTTFVYDFSGQRVKKNATIYIGKLYECTGGTCTKYIFAGGNRIAYKTGSAVYYYHTDHLGSSSIITNTSGTKVNELYYYPYGKTRYALDSSLTHKFTGQEEDEETGLYYYGARYYDPAIGRFVSADSIVPDFSDPQTLNRYSYCRNNPIILTDPSGNIFGIDDLLAIGIGAAIGAISSGLQSDWNLEAMATGAFIGGVSAGVFSGVEGAVAGAIQNSVTNATVAGAISGAAGGAAAGMVGGGLSAAFSGGNIGQGMLKGGLIGGAVGGIMGAINGSLKSDSLAPADANDSLSSSGTVPRIEGDRVIFYDPNNDGLLFRSALNENLNTGEYGIFGHIPPEGRYFNAGNDGWLSGTQLGRSLPKYGFNPAKFTSIKVYGCNSALGGQNSVAAGVWRVTHKPTTGAILKIWGNGRGFLSLPYGVREILYYKIPDFSAPGHWVTFGGQ